jgi:hypothetical protein
MSALSFHNLDIHHLGIHLLEPHELKAPAPLEIVDCVLDQMLGPTGTLSRALSTEDDFTAHDRRQTMTAKHNGINRRSDR